MQGITNRDRVFPLDSFRRIFINLSVYLLNWAFLVEPITNKSIENRAENFEPIRNLEDREVKRTYLQKSVPPNH